MRGTVKAKLLTSSQVNALVASHAPPLPQLRRVQLLDLQHAQLNAPDLQPDRSTLTTWVPAGAFVRVHCTRRQPPVVLLYQPLGWFL